jgi:hypothetical protein
MAHMSTLLVVLVLAVGCVLAYGVSAADKFDISRNLADDTLPAQGLASGAQRTSAIAPTGQRGAQLFGIDILAFANSSGPCPEDVHLTGNVHLVTEIRRQKSGLAEIMVIITLVGVEGKGEHTGARYVATGAGRQDVATPTLPSSVQVEADFDFIPLGACRLPSRQVEHLPVRFELEFDEVGTLLRMTALPEFGDTLLGLNQVRLAAFTISLNF